MMESKRRRNISIPDFIRPFYLFSNSSKRKESNAKAAQLEQENGNQCLNLTPTTNNQTLNQSLSAKSIPSVSSQSLEASSSSSCTMPSLSSFTPSMMLPPLPSFVTGITTPSPQQGSKYSNQNHHQNQTANQMPHLNPLLISNLAPTYSQSQLDAQSALLLAVIKATPNEVFYNLAKDFLWSSYQTVKDAISKNLPNRPSFYGSARKRNQDYCCSSEDEYDLADDDSGFFSGSSSHRHHHRHRSSRRHHNHKRSHRHQQQIEKKSDYQLVRTFLKIIIKLYLTLILEVVTLALKLLG